MGHYCLDNDVWIWKRKLGGCFDLFNFRWKMWTNVVIIIKDVPFNLPFPVSCIISFFDISFWLEITVFLKFFLFILFHFILKFVLFLELCLVFFILLFYYILCWVICCCIRCSADTCAGAFISLGWCFFFCFCFLGYLQFHLAYSWIFPSLILRTVGSAW